MVVSLNNFRVIFNKCTLQVLRRQYTGGKILYNQTTQTPQASSSAGPNVSNAVGLSNAVVKETNEPVGPGALKSGEYKNPEYYCYDTTSFFEAEVELLKYRLPQPSSIKSK